ncbi:MAG: DUF559 domain-containing protein, partial [Candidatus Peregrinibacteria bacterium]
PTPGPYPESGEGGRGGGRVWRGVEELRYAPGVVVGHARDLRREPTKAEELLWNALRRHQIVGTYFRRQHPIGTFILDFYCAEVRLGIEIDGSIHHRQDVQEYDAYREEELRERGIELLRFSNNEILNDIDVVLQTIEKEVLIRQMDPDDVRLEIRAPANILRSVAPKGAIAVDGVSLTVTEKGTETFTVALIPMTLTLTILGRKRMGDRVNIETDILVRTLLAAR